MIPINIRMKIQNFFGFLGDFLKRRWRSLLLLVLGVGLPLIIAEILVVGILHAPNMLSWDVPILLAVHAQSTPKLDHFVIWFTRLGTYYGVFPASFVVGVLLLVQQRWRMLVFWLIALGGCAILNLSIKILLHRARPDLWLSPAPEFDYGFPSGHAMSSMGFVVTLVVLTAGSRWQGAIAALGGIFVLAIAWSRMYLGVHFPSDILAGWLIAIAWVMAVSLVIPPRPSSVSATLDAEAIQSASEPNLLGNNTQGQSE